ncbi:hypothetical protein BJX76DRAFT_361130 [Aspergillus varians]
MSGSSSPDYKALFLKAEGERKQAEERQKQEAALRKQAEERQRQAEEKERQERERNRPTTFGEFSHNRLVTVFLRKLEYYEGVLFLTTNRLMEFDEAVLSRIHLKIKYLELTKDARRKIWEVFFQRLVPLKGPP